MSLIRFSLSDKEEHEKIKPDIVRINKNLEK